MYLLHVCIVCLSVVAVRSSYVRKSASSTADQIRLLMDEEKALRENIQAKVRRLQSEVNVMTDTIAPCSCPTTTTPTTTTQQPQVAYTGTLPLAKSSLTGNTNLNFSGDLVNIGTGYRSTSSHFKAPVSGLYGFSLAIYLNPGYWAGFRLVNNGNGFLSVKTGHYRSSSSPTNDRQVNMATNYVISNVTVGEEIWPQYVTGSGRIWAEGVTTFTAVLLHPF